MRYCNRYLVPSLVDKSISQFSIKVGIATLFSQEFKISFLTQKKNFIFFNFKLITVRDKSPQPEATAQEEDENSTSFQKGIPICFEVKSVMSHPISMV